MADIGLHGIRLGSRTSSRADCGRRLRHAAQCLGHAAARHPFRAPGLLNRSAAPADYRFYVSDIPLRFQTIGERFLGRSLEQIEMMRLG